MVSASTTWARALLIGAIALPLSLAAHAAGKETVKRTPVETLSIAGQTGRVESGQKFFGNAKFVGAESCKSCHEKQHAEWMDTWHAKMERWPSPETVIGDFGNRTINWKNIRIRDKDGKESRISPSGLVFREGGKYRFTLMDKDNPANNQTYEVAKTLGGKWDQGYEVRIGDNYIPAPIRWSVAAQDWLIGGFRVDEWFVVDGTPDGRPRRPEELPLGRVAEAKCNGCHTTGFEFVQDKETKVWKGVGKGELGIACEKCHGPGSKHVAEAESAKASGKPLDPAASTIVHPLKDLNALQQTEVCGQCHGRNTNKTITDLAFPIGFLPGDVDMTTRSRYWSYSGSSNPTETAYFWPNDWAARNRQQSQDYQKSAHFNKAGMSCLTCHTFHGKSEGAQLRQKPEEMCVSCHSGTGYAKRNNAEMFADSPMAKAGVQCIDCHMPKIGSRSRATGKTGHQWDTASHTFLVATPALEKAQGIRSSCASCHEGEGKKMAGGAQTPAFDTNTLDILLKQKQSMTREEIEAVEKLLAKANVKKPAARKLAEEARGKLNFVLLDGSLGFHNQEKAMAHIAEARKLAEKAVKVR
jgi:predicted CXXCH cytochrome family protein